MTVVYQNPWLRVREEQYLVSGETKTYAIVDRDHSVVIIPLSPTGRTLLLRQYRYPTEEFSWEFPMGSIDEGETPQEAANRELQEETRIDADRIISLGQYRAVPGLTPQRVHIFLAHATDNQLDAAVDATNVDDIHERRVLPMAELFDLVAQNVITDGFTLASLLMFWAAPTFPDGFGVVFRPPGWRDGSAVWNR
jgi:8-oxo-dGTP pyrophosphatase MutT (NUDIX family)